MVRALANSVVLLDRIVFFAKLAGSSTNKIVASA
jgi:hypothetical protein